MERIDSFSIDHLKLEPGVYVSRKDQDPASGGVVTTFDVRMTAPNREPVMDTAVVHAIEHLGATFLRNDGEWKDRILYFGPMGCRTGFYLLVFGDVESVDVMPLLTRMFEFCSDFEGDVPGASAQECGNYHDSDLAMCKWQSRRYLENSLYGIDSAHMTYPQI